MSADPRAASFGAVAEDYERGRPGWPARVVEVAGLPPEAEVLDLAAGTGKLTQLLAERFERVVAVEPAAELLALNPAAERLAGRAEAIPLPDASVDGVFVAEAFHWFDGGRPLVESGNWREPFADGSFDELRYEEVVHEHVRDTEGDIAALLSISGLALLAPERRDALRAELRAALPEATWRTPLRCEIWWTRRR